ncbi:hypothetical protein BCR33DRAFT_847929 [Rhizoclosmatium globosum]|uniref:CHCH domain-containing protein n=1 Tax=Rhizoclosmatium globosum TaxID=329046 RepID=A0A1Y2CNG8_9FUNG|nr:hypothetical protein HDU79_002584 [Rhizoclosmatium sp. JEL0117]ORY48542.1 hypothetical protein BCR33DRAFT_847929 [Rhizoclosmatium globosum]|eukprot:ORY48542.1 hypothetical protein BCR33DRAFT_847929 [Rhizoclosmatium globosum]
MGLFSDPEGLPDPAKYCSAQRDAANKCMSDLNFDREQYRTKCSHLFKAVRDCRDSWKKLKKDLTTYERTGVLPADASIPEPSQQPK